MHAIIVFTIFLILSTIAPTRHTNSPIDLFKTMLVIFLLRFFSVCVPELLVLKSRRKIFFSLVFVYFMIVLGIKIYKMDVSERNVIFTSLTSCVFLILFYIVYVMVKNKDYYDEHFEERYCCELPSNCTPAEVSVLYMDLGPKDLAATLLDLARKKIISINHIQEKNDCDYKIELIRDLSSKGLLETKYKEYKVLKSHENQLIFWLMNLMGYSKNVYLSDILSHLKTESEPFFARYENWICELKSNTNKDNNFFREDPPFMFFGKYRRTKKAQVEYEKWQAFKGYLKKFSSSELVKTDSIILLEQYLVYAISFGIAERVLKNMKFKFSSEFLKDKDLVLLSSLGSVNNILDFKQKIENIIITAKSYCFKEAAKRARRMKHRRKY